MKILFITNVPSPYRVDFFNELGKKSELTVLFQKLTSDERNNSWGEYKFENFTGLFLKGVSTSPDTAFCPSILLYIEKGRYDHIIIAGICSLTDILAIEYMKVCNIPYFQEGDGGFEKSGKGIKEKYKKHLLKGAIGYFSSGENYDKYLVRYGADKNKIYRYPFTSLHENEIVDKLLSKEEKNLLKTKLGIPYKKIILSVGRFIYSKGYDVLINSAKALTSDIGIYIVGGQATEDYIKLKEMLGVKNIQFIDYKNKYEIFEYYKAADLFVLPTRGDVWGLVINEAMACGLPIITTDRCGAGLELVKNGENGYIIPTDNIEAISEKIKIILEDDILRERMGLVSIDIIREYTIENMVNKHLEILSLQH